MEIFGKIIAALPPRTGISSKGTQWQSNSYVLETQERYPKRMAFDVFGIDKIQNLNIQIGEMLTVSFDIDAREHQGRWYNSISCWNVTRTSQTSVQQPVMSAQPVQGSALGIPPVPQPSAVPVQDKLPF